MSLTLGSPLGLHALRLRRDYSNNVFPDPLGSNSMPLGVEYVKPEASA